MERHDRFPPLTEKPLVPRDLTPENVSGEPPTLAPTWYEQALTGSFSEQVSLVQGALALNRSQMAEVLQISRPTLYAWLDGAQPHTPKVRRLHGLLRLISRAGLTSDHPLHPRFVRHPLSEHGPSLLERLAQDALPEEALLQSLIKAKEMTARWTERTHKTEQSLSAPNPAPCAPAAPPEKKAKPAFDYVLL